MNRALTALLLLAASCARTDGATLTVFAASSLHGAFTTIARDFEAANGVPVVVNEGSSTDLAAQIASEGTADVFASASDAAMDTVADEPGIVGRVDFATNTLVVITPPENPGGVSSIEDLTRPGLQLVLGAEGVPVGDYARQALANAGILEAALANVVSNEEDDAGVVAKIAANEADAAIVYRSDVHDGAAVRSVAIADGVNVIATYPIGVLAGSPNAELGTRFVAAVLSSGGQQTLAGFGFGAAPAEG